MSTQTPSRTRVLGLAIGFQMTEGQRDAKDYLNGLAPADREALHAYALSASLYFPRYDTEGMPALPADMAQALHPYTW